MRWLNNKTDWKETLAKHPVVKAKDGNCPPAIFYVIDLPSVRDARPHLAGEDAARRRLSTVEP